MSGDCGHGWMYHFDGPSGACYKCVMQDNERLRAEVAALNLALENSGTRHEYTAPPGMVFVPEDFLAERDRLLELYEELLLAVGNKYEGESRHQTALRYIKQAEEVVDRPAQSALGKEER